MTDPFEHDDAAYVLGALSPGERDAFETHLLACADCMARVVEVDDATALLTGVDVADVEGPSAGAVPQTLLPAMLRSARRERQRQRWLTGSLAAVAAACVVALVIALWPSSSTSTAPRRSFVPVAQSPVLASATLTAEPWGTQIDVRCRYGATGVDRAWRYELVAYDRQGNEHRLGDWRLPPDRKIEYQAGTSLLPDEIKSLVITLPDGTAVLKLSL